MDDKSYPPAGIADRFLGIVTNPDNWPVYVHCAGGRHRTGAMTAVYRIAIDGWDADRAYREMKEYDYYSRWGHGDMKDFVYDFYREQIRRPSSSVQTISGFPPQ
jgi:tyrosine-protein phosphatase SIW14